MRATDLIAPIALGARCVVFTSSIWRTTCTVHLGDGGPAVVDALVLPRELALLPALVAEVAGPAPPTLLATHGDWDHLFARVAFPDAPLRCMPSTCARVASEGPLTDREIDTFFGGFYLDPLRIPLEGAMPVTDGLTVAGQAVRSVPAPGHSSDGGAYLFEGDGVLHAGDYLSPVEIPRIRQSVELYRASLVAMRPLLDAATWVVPGHGWPLGRPEAEALWAADLAYVDRLVERGAAAALPADRDSPGQRAVHREMNVARIGGGPMTESDIASLFPPERGD